MIILTLILLAYMTPGLFFARGYYSEQIREINSRPVTVVPPKPETSTRYMWTLQF